MNRKKLAQQIADLESIARALREELDSAGPPDAFALHVVHSRQAARAVGVSDKSKHGRHIIWQLEKSFAQARELGFRGGLEDWRKVLWAHVPASTA